MARQGEWIRLFVPEPLAAGAVIGLQAEQAHYLRHVMRAGAGQPVLLFNGTDGEWRATIDGFGKGWCSVTVAEQQSAPEPEPDLWLVFAAIRRTRIDFLLEKGTELGVTRFVPLVSAHSVVDRVKPERLQARIIQAAEQCGRVSVPEIEAVKPLHQCLEEWPPERRLYIGDTRRGTRPFASVLSGDDSLRPRTAAILIGPEGGLSDAEYETMQKSPFVTFFSLGPRILRAETAAIVAVALWQALAGADDTTTETG